MAYIPLRRTPLRERASILFLDRGQIHVDDNAFVMIDAEGRTQIPVAGLSCVMLGPGTDISHAAVKLAAEVGCLLVWTGEEGVRVYSAGEPGGASARHILHQARIVLDETARLNVVRAMYAYRFGEDAPQRRSIEQLRGLEGVRVREAYKRIAAEHGVDWRGRNYNFGHWKAADVPNQCLSAGTSCLYGLAEAAILAAGYAPQLGFLHQGNARSFVFDIADLFKFKTVVPEAFRIAGEIAKGQHAGEKPERLVRIACRDAFRKTRLVDRIIPTIHDMLAASGLDTPEEAPEAMPPAHPAEEAA